MKKLTLLLTTLVVLFGSTACLAQTSHILTWIWPIDNCDQTPLNSADFIESELIYSTVEMPMTSDREGGCSDNRDADPPAGSLSVPIPLATNSIQLNNLQPGEAYFARIRVSAYQNGNWSSWSRQAKFTIVLTRPNIIRFSTAMLDRWEYHTIGISHMEFFRSTS